MSRLPLTKGKFVIIDANQFSKWSKYKLFLGGGSCQYAQYCAQVDGEWKTFLLHRTIVGAKKGDIVDHINRNPLDCRRENLRIVSHRQNILNSRLGESSGVYFDKRRKSWTSRIRIGNNKRLSLGSYENRKEAEKVYKNAFKKYSLYE